MALLSIFISNSAKMSATTRSCNVNTSSQLPSIFAVAVASPVATSTTRGKMRSRCPAR